MIPKEPVFRYLVAYEIPEGKRYAPIFATEAEARGQASRVAIKYTGITVIVCRVIADYKASGLTITEYE